MSRDASTSSSPPTRYVKFYLDHMRTEETELLPAAERVLSPADWAELDKAFAADRDPLAGGARDPIYNRLFTRIVLTAPAPIGVGRSFEARRFRLSCHAGLDPASIVPRSHGSKIKARGKVVSGQAAAHRQGGRCFAPTSLGLLGFVARRGTHYAP